MDDEVSRVIFPVSGMISVAVAVRAGEDPAGYTRVPALIRRNGRGRIDVIDRKGLEVASRECYGRIASESRRVFE